MSGTPPGPGPGSKGEKGESSTTSPPAVRAAKYQRTTSPSQSRHTAIGRHTLPTLPQYRRRDGPPGRQPGTVVRAAPAPIGLGVATTLGYPPRASLAGGSVANPPSSSRPPPSASIKSGKAPTKSAHVVPFDGLCRMCEIRPPEDGSSESRPRHAPTWLCDTCINGRVADHVGDRVRISAMANKLRTKIDTLLGAPIMASSSSLNSDAVPNRDQAYDQHDHTTEWQRLIHTTLDYVYQHDSASSGTATPTKPYLHASRTVRAVSSSVQSRIEQLESQTATSHSECTTFRHELARRRAALSQRRSNLGRVRSLHLSSAALDESKKQGHRDQGLAVQVDCAQQELNDLRQQSKVIATAIQAQRARLVRSALQLFRLEPPRASLAHVRSTTPARTTLRTPPRRPSQASLTPSADPAPTTANEWTILGLVLPLAGVLPLVANSGDRSSLLATLPLPEINGATQFTAQLLRLLSTYTGVSLPFEIHLPGRTVRQRTRMVDSGVGGEVVPNVLWAGATLHPPALSDVFDNPSVPLDSTAGAKPSSKNSKDENERENEVKEAKERPKHTARPLGPLPLALSKEAHADLRTRIVVPNSSPSSSTLLSGAALGALGGARTGVSRLMESFVHLDTLPPFLGSSPTATLPSTPSTWSNGPNAAPAVVSPGITDDHQWSFVCALAALAYNTAYLAESQGMRALLAVTPVSAAKIGTIMAGVDPGIPSDPLGVATRYGSNVLRTLAHLAHAPQLGSKAHDNVLPNTKLHSFSFHGVDMREFVLALSWGRKGKSTSSGSGSGSGKGKEKVQHAHGETRSRSSHTTSGPITDQAAVGQTGSKSAHRPTSSHSHHHRSTSDTMKHDRLSDSDYDTIESLPPSLRTSPHPPESTPDSARWSWTRRWTWGATPTLGNLAGPTSTLPPPPPTDLSSTAPSQPEPKVGQEKQAKPKLPSPSQTVLMEDSYIDARPDPRSTGPSAPHRAMPIMARRPAPPERHTLASAPTHKVGQADLNFLRAKGRQIRPTSSSSDKGDALELHVDARNLVRPGGVSSPGGSATGTGPTGTGTGTGTDTGTGTGTTKHKKQHPGPATPDLSEAVISAESQYPVVMLNGQAVRVRVPQE